MPKVTLIHGDCLEEMKKMESNSVDSICCDPPYGLSFMGKKWDYDVPSEDIWRECLRVLKPGGHLLAFAGTRTQHRMAVRIEDAGFEIRDMIAWVYGSGFPKSHNLKDEWQGWGTALKPAHEPICVARKPLIGTVAENVMAHGTGALNIDGCRVGTDGGTAKGSKPHGEGNGIYGAGLHGACEIKQLDAGRWPANLIHDGSEEVVGLFPTTKSVASARGGVSKNKIYGTFADASGYDCGYNDQGSAARFFYCAKASKKDRDEGCDALAVRSAGEVTGGREEGSAGLNSPRAGAGRTSGARNHHPTVKPTDLMRYLCRLVTPPGGLVLDPFMGSGSTGKAAVKEGFSFIGIEREAEYVEIAKARIESCK